MFNGITKWIKRPKKQEAREEFERLNWELFHDERGQRWIYLYKMMVNYDRNPRELDEDLRVCDIMEGKKDAARLIENILQIYSTKLTQKKGE